MWGAILGMAAGMLLPAAPASAASSDPAQWPEVPGLDPELTATPHTIRFSGPDRFQTNLALNLALRGEGDFPFDTSDRTSGNAAGLAEANDWWGPATCPRSIIVVAGDTFADALAAASLSDPTDQSDQPRLQRVASADPLFDPRGGFDRVETAYAPIVVTESARSGATALAQSARLTADDLANGGCTTAREAIVVGGTGAVPRGVEAELVDLGYDEVFRVGGSGRYETAAAIATALGTEPAPAGGQCLDRNVHDGDVRLGFYGNAVPEYRFDADSCRLLSRSVVLADGGTGADALAAGWWTSRWQVPVLLTAPDGSLPTATRTALRTMDIDHIIVLGGTGRIPEETTVDVAERLAGAVAGRIAGADRYATSVAMAEAFGGWFPTGDGADFDRDQVCLAASSGSGSNTSGWPDALAAGTWCARLATAGRPSPIRSLPGAAGQRTGGAPTSHHAIPILLVPAGDDDLHPTTSSHLRGAFDPSGPWCAPGRAAAGCLAPGFAVVFGGGAAVTKDAELEAGSALSGATSLAWDPAPELATGFATLLDLAPTYAMLGVDSRRVCFPRGAMRDVHWLNVADLPNRRSFVSEVEVDSRYGLDGSSLPTCAATPNRAAIHLTGVASTGEATSSHRFMTGADDYVAIDRPISQSGTGTGESDFHARFEGRPAQTVTLRRGAAAREVLRAGLDLELRSTGPGAASFTGVGTVSTAVGEVKLSFAGEATLVAGRWELRGRASSATSAMAPTAGGFRAQLLAGESPEISWRFDGFSTESAGVSGSS